MVALLYYVLPFLIGVAFQGIKSTGKLAKERSWQTEKKLETFRKRAYSLVTYYLLLRIGLIGGMEIKPDALLQTGPIVITLSMIMFILTFEFTGILKNFDKPARLSAAAHYGSISIGAFTAALGVMDGLGFAYGSEVYVWIAIMELLAVLLGILLLNIKFCSLKRLQFQDKSIMILPLSLLVGAIAGSGLLTISLFGFLLKSIFNLILAYFLFELGTHVYGSLRKVKCLRAVVELVKMGILLPLKGGTIGTWFAGLFFSNLSNIVIMGVLEASATYVTAPTFINSTIKTIYQKRPVVGNRIIATNLSLALGITLTFNILIGISILYLSEGGIFLTVDLPVKMIVLLVTVIAILTSTMNRLYAWLFQGFG